MRVVALLLFAATGLANQISVEPRAVRVGERMEITVVLHDTFARTDRLGLPITNLEIDQGPSISNQYHWTGGESSRTRTYRYIARAKSVGTARVGPIDLVDEHGQRLRLDPVTIQVNPDDSPSVDALASSMSRKNVFVTVEADKQQVFLGEQVVITWTLYSREPIRGFRLTSVPVLENFWAEEIPQPRQEAERIVLRGLPMHRSVIRRVALYPLRTGTQRVAPLETLAEIFLPDDFFRGWGFLDRRIEDVRVRSGALELGVRGVPTSAEAAGEFTIDCGAPVVPVKGPVSFDVTLTGTGNLRAVNAPEFQETPPAAVEVQSRDTRVLRTTQPIRMNRTWRFLLFAHGEGHLRIPPVHFDFFDTAEQRNRSIQCAGRTLRVSASNVSGAQVAKSVPLPAKEDPARRVSLPFAIGVAALALSGAVWAGAVRSRTDSPLVETLWGRRSEPAEMRRTLHEAVNAAGLRYADLFREDSSLGEAFRALHSLIDLLEKEPWEAPTTQRELRRRIREFDREFRRRK